MPISLEKPRRPKFAKGDIIPFLAPTRSSVPDTPGNHGNIDLPDDIGNVLGNWQNNATVFDNTRHSDTRHTEAREEANFNADTAGWTAWLEMVRTLARAAAQQDHDAALRLMQGNRDEKGE